MDNRKYSIESINDTIRLNSNLFKEKFDENLLFLQNKTKLKRRTIYAITCVSFFLIVIGWFDTQVSFLLTTCYPILWTLKAIKVKDFDESKLWLAYWPIYSLFVFCDLFSDWIIAVVPFYYLIRTLLLLWLYLPNFKGARIIYSLFLEEAFKTISAKEEKGKDTLVHEIQEILRLQKELTEKEQINFQDKGDTTKASLDNKKSS